MSTRRIRTNGERPTESLVEEFARTRAAALREEIIQRHRPLVRSVAQKFLRPGVSLDDLVQTAWVALIGALDRYDAAAGARFSTYAVFCMVGEIKRYFRDHTWSFRAPRRLQEIAANLLRVEDELMSRLQRRPTVADMAAAFNASEDEMLQAMELHQGYRPHQLDLPGETPDGDGTAALAERIGETDPRLEFVVERTALSHALSSLDARKRSILLQRFMEGRTQQEVAADLGVSQIHVSRLERRALEQLRLAFAEG